MRGGMGDYTRELGVALARMGHEVLVITHAEAGTIRDTSGRRHLAVYPAVPRWNWRGLRRVLALVRDLGPDILHIQYQTAAYGMHPAVNFLPWLARRLVPGVRLAITYHDLLVPYLFPKAGPLRRWITYLPARQAHLVIATNAEDSEVLRRAGISPVQIPIGPNVHPVRVTPADVRAFREQHRISEQAAVIGYFGFLNRSKGVTDLVRAVATLIRQGRDVHLLMLGEQVGASDPTNRAYKEEVEALIARESLLDRVHWTGFLDDAALSVGFAACDVVALPYRDGASLRRGTLQAALVHGAAIVTTRPRVDQGADFASAMVLVPPGDPDALARAVAHVLDTPDQRRSLQQQARVLSRHFTWDKIASGHVEAYARLLEEA